MGYVRGLGTIKVPKKFERWFSTHERSFHDLTPEEKARICNGCGSKFKGKLVPDFAFTDACNWHDWLYHRGGSKRDRRLADAWFYYLCRRKIERLPWYRRPLAHLAAGAFWAGVRIGGKRSWGKAG